ncbi:MAG: hypothetical protein WA667_05550 [Candidatus Nitrosopolaris sp.]
MGRNVVVNGEVIDKVMRNLKKKDAPILEGYQISSVLITSSGDVYARYVQLLDVLKMCI